MPKEVEETSLWGRIHIGDYNCKFDYEEFENMFSQKEKSADEKIEKKKEAIMLVDAKAFQMISICLYKLPNIPVIQRAVLELDEDALGGPEVLEALSDPKLLSEETKKEFQRNQHLKPVEEYEPVEQFLLMAFNIPEMHHRLDCWHTSFGWRDAVEDVISPIEKLHSALTSVHNSKHLPYFLGLILGFGNMMNFDNANRGNAPIFSLATLEKLDGSKDNRGKVSLMTHLIQTVKRENPEALMLAEELEPLIKAKGIKLDDLESSIKSAENQLKAFNGGRNKVKKALSEGGTDAEDPFIPRMTTFASQAEEDIHMMRDKMKEMYATRDQLNTWFGFPKGKEMSMEEVIMLLTNLVEKVGIVLDDVMKERKKLARKGKTIDSNIDSIVDNLNIKLQDGTA